jgi:hypothetical protein
VGDLKAGVLSDSYTLNGTITTGKSSGLIGGIGHHAAFLNSFGKVSARSEWLESYGIVADHWGMALKNVFSLSTTGSIEAPANMYAAIATEGYSGATSNCFYSQQISTCTKDYDGTPILGCSTDLCTAIDTSSNPGYFYSKSNAPLDQWNFDWVWQENSGALPTLRHRN